MNPRNLLIILFLLFVSLFITNGVPFIYSDGFAAYHTANSVVEKGSWVSPTEPEYIDYKGHVIDINKKGEYSVVYPPGSAIFNLPGQFIAEIFKDDRTIYNDYFMATNGHTLAQGIGFLITANIFGFLTVILLYQITKAFFKIKRFKFNLEKNQITKIALVSATASYFSSYAIWYVMLNSSFTHTYELFSTTLFLWAFIKYLDKKRFRYTLIAGLGLGLATLCRPVLLIFGVPVGLYFAALSTISLIEKFKPKSEFFAKLKNIDIPSNHFEKLKQNSKWHRVISKFPIIGFIAGGLPSAILLMSYNYVSYGKLIASGYEESRGETFQFQEWNGLKILFSFQRGWFIYSPVFFFAIIGLILLSKKSKWLSLYLIFCIFSLVGIYGFWPSWWAGGSYGHRFMIPLMPFASIGLSYLIYYSQISSFNYKFRKIKALAKLNLYHLTLTLILILTAWSVILTLLYRFTPVAELRPKNEIVESGGRFMYSGDRYTPYDIFKYQYNLLANASSPTGYVSDLLDSGNGGNSFVPIFLGLFNTTVRLDDRAVDSFKLLILKPPIKKYELDSEIVFYIQDTETVKIYEVKLHSIDSVDAYDFNAKDIMQSKDTNMEIKQIKEKKLIILNSSEYKGFYAGKGRFKIYFPVANNKLFFKASPINLPDGIFEYRVN